MFRGKKSKISRDFQGQIRRKIGQFCVDMTSIYLTLSTTVRSRNERMLKLLTLWLVPSFSQRSSKNAW